MIETALDDQSSVGRELARQWKKAQRDTRVIIWAAVNHVGFVLRQLTREASYPLLPADRPAVADLARELKDEYSRAETWNVSDLNRAMFRLYQLDHYLGRIHIGLDRPAMRSDSPDEAIGKLDRIGEALAVQQAEKTRHGGGTNGARAETRDGPFAAGRFGWQGQEIELTRTPWEILQIAWAAFPNRSMRYIDIAEAVYSAEGEHDGSTMDADKAKSRIKPHQTAINQALETIPDFTHRMQTFGYEVRWVRTE